MAVTTRLTWSEEKSLQKMLGNVSLRLLYKSSVHENKTSSILDKCSCQGPTVTIIYIRNTTVGVFMLGPYSKTYDHLKRPNPSFYFSYQRNIATEMRTAVLETEIKIASGQLVFYSSGQEVLSVCLNDTKLSINDSLSKALGVYNRSDISYLECEVFRVEGIEDDTNYIRKITRAMKHRNPLLSELRTYKPCVDFVSKVRILLLGPVGSGKSSFINSVKSVFQGRLTRQAAVGSDVTSITEQLNPNKPITPNHPNFISTPSLKDSIHCVAYVMDINSINDLSSKMVAKLKQVQKEVLSCGRACVLLLTKVTNCSEFLQDNSLNMDKPMTSQSQIMHVSKMLSVPIYNTFMVENYTSEWELDPLKDTQILFVLRQMLRVAEDFFEDLP
ncbi:interferon-induced protein 44-like isoform X2 [Ursus maritimus]|uniref:Interferon-induced protein 44-like isoform X2 n=1 Tax=Ursus maritimus TaxID=29073 RepID=A0A8M1FI38_URSMA|nr:interferon-induced protein 44-like isoform X2 [Ursus maritimus]